jgi:hypothetical protein
MAVWSKVRKLRLEVEKKLNVTITKFLLLHRMIGLFHFWYKLKDPDQLSGTWNT